MKIRFIRIHNPKHRGLARVLRTERLRERLVKKRRRMLMSITNLYEHPSVHSKDPASVRFAPWIWYGHEERFRMKTKGKENSSDDR